jgi:2-polyprenyl-3-methyl-5-hydroxy-6-metoxy-1,4-benzoquinol methylase
MSHDVYHIMDRVKGEKLYPLLPPRSLALEVGCGQARLSSFLAVRGHRICGLDYSFKALQTAETKCRAYGIPGDFCCGDAFRLPFAEDSFDVVLSTGLIEHYCNPLPLVEEMVRVLKPKGLFYPDIVPRKFSLLRAFDSLRLTRRRGKVMVFERRMSTSEMNQLMSEAGLERIEVLAAGVFPLLAKIKLYNRLHTRLSSYLAPLLARLDGTAVARHLGFYFFIHGYRSPRDEA